MTSINETVAQPCGWCGRRVRWGVPRDRAAHAWGACVGNSVAEEDKSVTPYHGRCSVFVVSWADDVSGDDIRRLSRGWSAKISEKETVAHVHVNTYGTIET